jgi:oligopeptide transport system ATP-binding protein
LITHDLGVVADVADRIAVMYAGRIVEQADVLDLYRNPAHPYAKGLLESIPRLDQKGQELAAIGGLPPNLTNIPPGCPFNPRCKYAEDVCTVDPPPPLREVEYRRWAACHFAESVLAGKAEVTHEVDPLAATDDYVQLAEEGAVGETAATARAMGETSGGGGLGGDGGS